MQIYKWMPAKIDEQAQLVLANQDGFSKPNDQPVLASNNNETNDTNSSQKISPDDTINPTISQIQLNNETTVSLYEPHTENKRVNPTTQEPVNNNKENLVTDPNINTWPKIDDKPFFQWTRRKSNAIHDKR